MLPSFLPSFEGITLFRHFAPGPRPRHSIRPADFKVGDDNYNVILPFVHLEANKPRKAIKPLHLDKPTPTEIYRHGDAWISTVRRLRAINLLPNEFLFVVKHPGGGKPQTAAQEISSDLQRLDTLTIPFSDTGRIQEFAQC